MSRRGNRKRTKLERRRKAADRLNINDPGFPYYKEHLTSLIMSDKETDDNSDAELGKDGKSLKSHPFHWESRQLTHFKERLDKMHLETLTAYQKNARLPISKVCHHVQLSLRGCRKYG